MTFNSLILSSNQLSYLTPFHNTIDLEAMIIQFIRITIAFSKGTKDSKMNSLNDMETISPCYVTSKEPKKIY